MQILNPLKWLIFILSFSLALNQTKSHPEPTLSQPTPNNLTIPSYLTKLLYQWRNQGLKSQESPLKSTAPVIAAGIFCFLSASISSAGGIGGGGLFIPILTIVAGLDLKTASSFSAFMVTGGSVANVLYNLCGENLVDYDIALLSEPGMLLGVSIGVICNVVFPEWLITILFAIFLVWSTFKTMKNGIFYWKMETEIAKRNGCEEGNGDSKSLGEPLVMKKGGEGGNLRFPWGKMGVLVMIWFSFLLVYLLRGNRHGQGITKMEPCGLAYWALSMVQVPLAIAFTAGILHGRGTASCQVPVQQSIGELSANRSPKMLTFPLMALSAGILGGVFGIGGGMLISPLLLQVGISPEVTAATCSFMVFFSSTMSAFQYLLLGMDHTGTALVFAIICFVASILGLSVVQKLVKDFGRASLIVFSVGTVMALSTILMTSFGALDVWEDYTTGKYMGFKRPC